MGEIVILALVSHLGEAVVAVDGAITTGLEWHPRFLTAGITHDIVVFPLCPRGKSSAPGSAALRATTGLVQQPPRLEELLLSGGECKLTTALPAGQGLIRKLHHGLLILDRYPVLDPVCG